MSSVTSSRAWSLACSEKGAEMDAEERALLLDMASRLLRKGDGARLVAEICDSGLAEDLWADAEACSALLECQGAAAATSPLLELIALRDLYADGDHRLVLPLPGSAGPVARAESGDQVLVAGILTGQDQRRRAVVTGQNQVAWSVPLDMLESKPAVGLDGELEVIVVRGLVPAVRLPEPAGRMEAAAVRAAGWELIGVGEEALAVAVRHGTTRTQFGHPITSFQVVAHRLAQSRVDLSAARALLVGTGDAALPAAIGKAMAGRAALQALAAAQQVCGAMGFTAEFGLHRLVRRGYLLDSLLGGSESAPTRIAELLGDEGLPRLVALERSGRAD
jgi:hypothetical protein